MLVIIVRQPEVVTRTPKKSPLEFVNRTSPGTAGVWVMPLLLNPYVLEVKVELKISTPFSNLPLLMTVSLESKAQFSLVSKNTVYVSLEMSNIATATALFFTALDLAIFMSS